MAQNLLARALAGIALAAATAAPAQVRPAADPLKVGFVFVTPIGDAGWTYQHDEGRIEMERALGSRVRTSVVENVAEGADAERVMRDLAQRGHGLIFATSFGYLEPALRVAADFPEVKFEHAGGYRRAPNLNTYNARVYEGRYLAGMLAGYASRSGRAGYVAGFPVPEVVQGINAFALGMRAVNPRAEVRVVWLNAWFDPPREREAALALIHQGADVLANHTASTAVAQTAEEKGVKVAAHQSDMRRVAPTAQLASVTLHWGGYYTRVAQSVLAGSWRPQPAWGGLADGFVRLSALDPSLPKHAVKAVEARRDEIADGRFHPFGGRIVDSRGAERLAPGRVMDDASIASMNWFVQGVVGSVPGP